MKKIVLTPLGTISPYCKNDMNCPGFLIEYDNQKILLDCGNGITRMLKFPNDLNNLHIFISHYHNDHYGDLGILQYASYVYHNLGMLEDKINMYLPEIDFNFSKQGIITNLESYANYHDINENKNFQIGNIKTSFHDNNSHTINTYVIKIEIDDFKIIYTSDIGYTNIEALASFSENADLIICESSFLEKHNANSKTHLTAKQAGKIAKLAKAKQLLLTHFWPEIDKKEYLEEAKQEFENTSVAVEGKKLVLKGGIKC